MATGAALVKRGSEFVNFGGPVALNNGPEAVFTVSGLSTQPHPLAEAGSGCEWVRGLLHGGVWRAWQVGNMGLTLVNGNFSLKQI